MAYGACHRVLHELRCRRPSFEPTRVFEFGAALAPGCWAARSQWPSAAPELVAVDPNAALRAAGAELCSAEDAPPITWEGRLAEGPAVGGDTAAADLVLAAYGLARLRHCHGRRASPRSSVLRAGGGTRVRVCVRCALALD